MNLTDQQKKTAQAIVNIFETGKAEGDYSAVTVLEGDSGGLSYGRSQATLNSGNLHKLIVKFCEAYNIEPIGQIKGSWLRMLAERNQKLNSDREFKDFLRQLGENPVMRKVQDEFFEQGYWEPAIRKCVNLGFELPLSASVVYDSCIQGSWNNIRSMTLTRVGNPNYRECSEKEWITEYVRLRRQWLKNRGGILAKTVYRMDAFMKLIEFENWILELPITVQGVTIESPIKKQAEAIEGKVRGT